MSTTPSPTPKSQLIQIGVLLMVVGLFGRMPLARLVLSMDPGLPKGILFVIATDGLTLCFVAGATCALIGWLRKRRAQRASETQK